MFPFTSTEKFYLITMHLLFLKLFYYLALVPQVTDRAKLILCLVVQ